MQEQYTGRVIRRAVQECVILLVWPLPGYLRWGRLNLVMLCRLTNNQWTDCRNSNLRWVRCSDRSTGGTTSHPTKQPEDGCQVVGYSHSTRMIKALHSHSAKSPKDGDIS